MQNRILNTPSRLNPSIYLRVDIALRILIRRERQDARSDLTTPPRPYQSICYKNRRCIYCLGGGDTKSNCAFSRDRIKLVSSRNLRVTIQRSEKRIVNLVKQDLGRGRQNN